MILLLQNERELAEEHFDAGRKAGGQDPADRMSSLASVLPPKARKRRQELYGAVLLMQPSNNFARYEVASQLLAQRRFEQAASHFRILVKNVPSNSLGMIGLAKAQRQLGQVQEARRMVERVLQMTPSDPAALALQAQLSGR